jgi:hypothetical protein
MQNEPNRKSDIHMSDDMADAYAAAVDSTCHLLCVTQNMGRQNKRIKPDPETNPLATLD